MNKENQKIEYKSSWKDEYLKWICGFANSDGGKLYIGIDDNGKAVGLDDVNELLESMIMSNLVGIFFLLIYNSFILYATSCNDS